VVDGIVYCMDCLKRIGKEQAENRVFGPTDEDHAQLRHIMSTTNLHIIIGPGRKCLCGIYGQGPHTKATGCQDILAVVDRLERHSMAGLSLMPEDAQLICQVLRSFPVENCDQPPHDTTPATEWKAMTGTSNERP
jgi:hypothetical protein